MLPQNELVVTVTLIVIHYVQRSTLLLPLYIQTYQCICKVFIGIGDISNRYFVVVQIEFLN